jgi:hypothetical protein
VSRRVPREKPADFVAGDERPADFDAYWAAIAPAVAPFEARRRQVRTRLLLAWAALSVPAVAVPWALVAYGGDDWLWGLWFVGSLLGYGILWHWATSDFRDDFKREIVEPAVRGYSKSLRYEPDGGFELDEVAASGLFPQPVPSSVRCEDLVAGRLGATRVRFCELEVTGVVERRRGGRRERKPRQLFAGLFLIADFHKHHRGAVHVLPRDPSPLRRLLDRIRGRSRRSWGDEVLMEDPDFNRHFTVHARDPVEARYVLSVSLIDRIRAFRERGGQPLMLGFVDGVLYLGVWTGRNLFEPRVFRTVDDRAIYRRFWEDMQLFGGVVEAFALNTRIWTKT